MRINFDVHGCLHLTFQVEICRLFPRTWALKFMFESIYVLVIQCSVVDDVLTGPLDILYFNEFQIYIFSHRLANAWAETGTIWLEVDGVNKLQRPPGTLRQRAARLPPRCLPRKVKGARETWGNEKCGELEDPKREDLGFHQFQCSTNRFMYRFIQFRRRQWTRQQQGDGRSTGQITDDFMTIQIVSFPVFFPSCWSTVRWKAAGPRMTPRWKRKGIDVGEFILIEIPVIRRPGH